MPADFAVFARYASATRSLPDRDRPWSPLAVDDALSDLRTAKELPVVDG